MSNRPGPLAQRIAAELRAELGRQNLSRRWLAEQIGQSHVNVSRWVNGDGGMSFDNLDSMCRALGITVADLLAAVERQSAVPLPDHSRTRRLTRAANATATKVMREVITDAATRDMSGRDTHQTAALAHAA